MLSGLTSEDENSRPEKIIQKTKNPIANIRIYNGTNIAYHTWPKKSAATFNI